MTNLEHIEIGHEYNIIEVEGNIAPAIQWCKDTFGPPGADRWFIVNDRFYFRQEKDSLWFELRW